MNHDPRPPERGPTKPKERRFDALDLESTALNPGSSAHGVPPAGTPRVLAPTSAVVALGAVYGVGALLSAIGAIFSDVDQVVGGFFLWGALWLVPGIPCVAAIALVGWRAERAISGTAGPAANRRIWAWGVLTGGILSAAHWAALGPWAPILVGAAILHPHHADVYLPLALLAFVAWLLAGGGAVLAVFGKRLLDLQDEPAARVSLPPSLVPTSALLGAAYGAALILPTAFCISWLDAIWSRGHGGVGVLGWALLGLAMAMMAGGATGTWLVAAAPVAPWTTNRPTLRQLEVAGAILVGHWIASFGFALVPILPHNDDLRYILLLSAAIGLVAGTTLWSFARTWRTLEDTRATVPG